jgi:hypothetical protein
LRMIISGRLRAITDIMMASIAPSAAPLAGTSLLSIWSFGYSVATVAGCVMGRVTPERYLQDRVR